jgi:sec-independent protein translocase protein TatA
MLNSFALLDFSTPELLIILAIILLLFGSKKLPELSRSLGDSMRELRKGMSDGGTENKKTQTADKDSASRENV